MATTDPKVVSIAERETAGPSILTESGEPPHGSGMDERILERVARLEGAVKAAAWALGLLLAAVLAVVSISAIFTIFAVEDVKEQVQLSEQRLNARMDGVETAVRALPGQLTDIATALSNAITASRSAPPPAEQPTLDEDPPR